MRRRDVIGLLGAAAGWPLTARGQSALPVIGFLAIAASDLRPNNAQAFRNGLSEAGYVEGRNVVLEHRSASGDYGRLAALADELIRQKVSVIIATGVPAAMAVKATGTTIPVIFYMGGDAIGLGLVATLNRPGGNFSGTTILNTELVPKRLELLRELVPAATSFSVLLNPGNRNAESQWRDVQAAARGLKLQLHLLQASNENELDGIFAELARLRVGGLVIGADGLFVTQSEQLGALTARVGMPAIFQMQEIDELRRKHGGGVPSGGHLCRARPQGRKARRSSGAAIHQVRTDHQSQNRQGARYNGSASVARPCRRGDRMTPEF